MATQRFKLFNKRKAWKKSNGSSRFSFSGKSKFGSQGFSMIPYIHEKSIGISGINQFFRNLVRGNR